MMNEEINSEILSRLDIIAGKLGVGAAHVWETLVLQAYLTGWYYLAYGIFFLLSSLFFGRLVKNSKKNFFSPGCDSHPTTKSMFFVLCLCSAITAFVFLIILNPVGHILNPEYYAFDDLVWKLRK